MSDLAESGPEFCSAYLGDDHRENKR